MNYNIGADGAETLENTCKFDAETFDKCKFGAEGAETLENTYKFGAEGANTIENTCKFGAETLENTYAQGP